MAKQTPARSRRTDAHRVGAIVPAEYTHVLSYDCGNSLADRGSFNVDCEREKAINPDGSDGQKRTHAPGLGCCLAALRERGDKFAEQGATGKCSVCGANFTYGDVFRHEPTGEHIHMGHDCADKYELLSDRSAFELELGRRERALATYVQRQINAERRTSFLSAHPGLEKALECEHGIVRDIANKFTTRCELSEKQIALVFKLAEEALNPKPEEKHVPAPEGRTTFTGTVVSVKSYDSNWGTSIKMLVKIETPDGCWLAWGTAPAAIVGQHGGLKGCTVEITATLKRGNEEHFALMSRPRGLILESTGEV